MIRYYDLDRWIGVPLARSPLNRSVCESRSALLASRQFSSENSAATPMREKWDRCDWFADARPSALHAPRRTYTRTQQPAIVPLAPRRVSSTSRKSRITVDLECHRFRAYLLTSSQYREFPTLLSPSPSVLISPLNREPILISTEFLSHATRHDRITLEIALARIDGG